MQSDADFWKNLFPFLHVYIVHDLSINLQIFRIFSYLGEIFTDKVCHSKSFDLLQDLNVWLYSAYQLYYNRYIDCEI